MAAWDGSCDCSMKIRLDWNYGPKITEPAYYLFRLATQGCSQFETQVAQRGTIKLNLPKCLRRRSARCRLPSAAAHWASLPGH